MQSIALVLLTCTTFSFAAPHTSHASLTVRDSTITSALNNAIPPCESDPTNAAPGANTYKVDNGVKVPKKGSNEACYIKNSRESCWTEYYVVEQNFEYQPYIFNGEQIDCATTSDCNTQLSTSNQTCTSVSVSTEQSFSVSLGASFDEILDVGVDASTSTTTENTNQTCSSFQIANQCSWTDKDCHSVWTQQENRRYYRYAQRVCTDGADKSEHPQQNTQRPDGKWVRGQLDFNFAVPYGVTYGCAAGCGVTTYPGNPQAPSQRTPFSAPSSWGA